jgi:hypothetical protein
MRRRLWAIEDACEGSPAEPGGLGAAGVEGARSVGRAVEGEVPANGPPLLKGPRPAACRRARPGGMVRPGFCQPRT